MMNVVMIIPTGIGCSIGGHAGDANPVAKLLGSVCDNLILHPNVVNAADINEMPENAWYVEGGMLDRFLDGEFYLKKPKSNKILLLVNKPVRPETINAVSAARHTIGCDIEIRELELQFDMEGFYNEDGTATGSFCGIESLVEQIKSYEFDAVAMATQIKVKKEIALNYFRTGGVNPWGKIEAIVSRAITDRINKPFAHAPIETDDQEIRYLNEVVDPRIAAEFISTCYIHCVFKGLHKAPRISDETGISVDDIDCLVTPANCLGPPHLSCLNKGIPIIAVADNIPIIKAEMPKEFIIVKNYIEATGLLVAMKAGIEAQYCRAD